MPRTHGHLDSDDTNEAAWVAARGATVGAARVSPLKSYIPRLHRSNRSRDHHLQDTALSGFSLLYLPIYA